jgi:hypothetical protein
MSSKTITPAATFSEGLLVKNQLQQQQKTVMEDETEVKVKVLNDHIVRLEAKLSFLTGSHGDDDYYYSTHSSYHQKIKIATAKQEIDEAMELKRSIFAL